MTCKQADNFPSNLCFEEAVIVRECTRALKRQTRVQRGLGAAAEGEFFLA